MVRRNRDEQTKESSLHGTSFLVAVVFSHFQEY